MASDAGQHLTPFGVDWRFIAPSCAVRKNLSVGAKRQPPVEGKMLHIYVRGVRKLPIVTDEEDRWMIIDSMYRANRRDAKPVKPGALFLPGRASTQNPMVEILSFCVLENHFHIQIKVKSAADASKFMHRLCDSITVRWQKKTRQKGRLFEATYRRKLVRDEYQARVLFAYISVKNAAEAAGINPATAQLDDLIEAAMGYSFSSLQDYYTGRNLPVAEKGYFLSRFPNIASLREFVSERPKKRAQRKIWRQIFQPES